MLHSARRGHPRTPPGVARRDRGRRLFLAAREIESRGGAYLEAENAYTAAMTKDIKPFEDALYAEMLARIKQTDLSVPVRRGELSLLCAH